MGSRNGVARFFKILAIIMFVLGGLTFVLSIIAGQIGLGTMAIFTGLLGGMSYAAIAEIIGQLQQLNDQIRSIAYIQQQSIHPQNMPPQPPQPPGMPPSQPYAPSMKPYR